MMDGLKGQEQAETDTVLIRALERRPEIAVPEDFAARVARSMPAKGPSRLTVRPVFGRLAGYLAVVMMMLVLVSMTWAHPAALEAGRGFAFALELFLVAQLLAVGLWVGLRSDGP